MRDHVMITGSAGRLGRAAVRALVAAGEPVVGYDLRPTPGLPPEQSIVGGLDDVAALGQTMAGAKCLVHLAATPDDAPGPDGQGDNFLNDLVPNNVVGPYRVMDAAWRHHVSQVILASTGQLYDGYLRGEELPVRPDALPRPRYLYACTKVFLEALGQVYSTKHGLTVVALRLGWCPRNAGQVAEIRASELAQDVYLSPGDAGRFFTAAVRAKGLPKFSVMNVTSRFTHRERYDLSETTRLTGWAPTEQWDTGALEG
ncbi:MAG TPA: NAD(P)-dependent oxidoreductase [Gemmataceae bacterium]|nr:NAD(P)-dependent oxidoreductase [Gemmataceae bacterium]